MCASLRGVLNGCELGWWVLRLTGESRAECVKTRGISMLDFIFAHTLPNI